MVKNSDGQMNALWQMLDSVKHTVENLAASLGFSPDEFKDMQEALLQGVPLYQIMGIQERVLKARYALAYQLYTSGKYNDAEEIFRWLCAYDNSSVQNWMGLGATRQGKKDYDGALEAYQMAAAYSSLQDPSPFYYSAICFLKQQKVEEAKVALQTVLTLGDKTKEDQKEFIDKAEKLLFNFSEGSPQ